jgi:hypothetical protein
MKAADRFFSPMSIIYPVVKRQDKFNDTELWNADVLYRNLKRNCGSCFGYVRVYHGQAKTGSGSTRGGSYKQGNRVATGPFAFHY